ncbi:hypothetical protein V6V47_10555 [Micromonospora sp. CPCC 205539]|uniref:hypothetical protein n=1 Tax=Micromonospora sp. CPCC 205539 TaxID=3122408 RepID=UPI002FF1F9BA
MTVDEELSRALADLTRTLAPEPDPYGRVRARYRRNQQRRVGGLALAAVVSVAGASFAIAGPGGIAEPSPPADSTESFSHVLAWSEKLLQSPPRGAVARDTGYIRDVAHNLLTAQRRGDFPRLTVPVSEVKVLFADDIDGQRIALAAFVREQPDPGTGWPNAAVWLVADEGATAKDLASTAAVRGTSDALEPYETIAVDDPTRPGREVHVAIAPAECVFLSSPAPETWTPEPTGSYLVRTPLTQRPEWWRVDCGSATRQLVPGPGSRASGPITDAQFATATARMRGHAEQQRSRELMREMAQMGGYRLTALPSVIWGGPVTGVPTGVTTTSPPPNVGNPRVTVLTAPAVGGGWVGQVVIDHGQPRPDTLVSTGLPFDVATDPTDTGALLAVPIDDDPTGSTSRRSLLVVTPAAATSVRVLRDGLAVANAPVSGSGAALTVPGPTTGLVVEALDASGGVVATGPVAAVGAQRAPHETDAWYQE